jgi:hypothetical protein
MTRTELIIQLLKVVIGLALGAYFVWWSLEVLDRLSPTDEAPTFVVRRIIKVNAPLDRPWMWASGMSLSLQTVAVPANKFFLMMA